MEQEKDTLLIIGKDEDVLAAVSKLLEENFNLLQAKTEKEGLSQARKNKPQAIILGYLEPRGASFELHKRFRVGWITKHIPMIILDIDSKDKPNTTWTRDEAMQMEAEDYISFQYSKGENLASLLGKSRLKESIQKRLQTKENLLKAAILDPDVFCVTWEQILGRGAFEIQQETVIDNVILAAQGGRVHGISVTDNPGGNPALSTEMLCAEIKKSHMEPLVHLACRDKNRNSLESMLYGIAAEGVRNILLLSGDFPSAEGYEGTPKPVFDMDPINVLRLVETMNNGLEHKVLNKTITLTQTDFFAGACVSPFKVLESELFGQYTKLDKKIRAGADFIIPQVGYDLRKTHEIIKWLEMKDYHVPVIANVYILPFPVARFMNGNNVPGCVVTDKLLEETREEAKAEDKGKSARLLRAAKQYAVAKGVGCGGAHIGGHNVTYEMVETVIDKGEELAKDWEKLISEFEYPQENGFYFFEKNTGTGLNSSNVAARTSRKRVPGKYRMARIAHSLLFNEKNLLFKILRPVAARIDRKPKRKKRFGFLEHLAKTVMFECMNCGDCALFDAAYICPMSQCPKQQRNGPCGGSYQGGCEVYPEERLCIWVQAYDRLKAFGEEHNIQENIVPPCNWALMETPSWLNFYLGRDHTAKRLNIKPPEKKEKPS